MTGSFVIATLGWTPALFGVHVPPRAVVFALLLGIPVAGFYAWREEHRNATERISRRKRQAILNELADRRAEGVNIYASTVANSGDALKAWYERYDRWFVDTRGFLDEHFERAAFNRFSFLGAFPSGEVDGSVNSQHSNWRLQLGYRLDALNEIIQKETATVKL